MNERGRGTCDADRRCDAQDEADDGRRVRYPPDGCLYEVRYSLGRRGAGLVMFPDEFALGRWFRAMAAEGMFEPADFTVPDEDGRNGYQIFCVTDGGRTEISYFHPRLVRGRLEGRRPPVPRPRPDGWGPGRPRTT